MARALSARPIICSGVSLGQREAVLEYVHAMAGEVRRLSSGIRSFGDQSLHNYLIYSKALNFTVSVTRSQDGIIGTLQYYDQSRISVCGQHIRLENDVIPDIVHQYDRFQNLIEHYTTVYK